jgi:hypothetical protein
VIHLFGRVVAPVASLASLDKGPFDGAVAKQMLVSRLREIAKLLPRCCRATGTWIVYLACAILLITAFVLDARNVLLVDRTLRIPRCFVSVYGV